MLIAISEPVAAILRAKFGFFIGNTPLWAIPNGIDEVFFCPGENARADDLILCVATLSPVKDQATLIQACCLLSERRRVRLVLAGDGVNRSKLEDLARKSGINDRITFLGNVGRARLLELYRSTAVFVLSTKSEGISLALLEAMACGCPIVASDVPGVTEVLAGTGAAVLVRQGHAPKMAEAIETFLDHRELGVRMGNVARECVLRNYSSKLMAARYKDILNQVDYPH
jgi:glycosyltransferase involved in cell wall biosynthesis